MGKTKTASPSSNRTTRPRTQPPAAKGGIGKSNKKVISNAEVEKTFGPKAKTLGSTVLSGRPLVIRGVNLDPLNRPNRAAHLRAWQLALSARVFTATQLASVSGGDLEVDAMAAAARQAGWMVADANRDLPTSVNYMINPIPGLPANGIALITKPKFPLGPLKKFALGRYPPWGPPGPAPDNPSIKCMAPPNPFQNNANWRVNNPLRTQGRVLSSLMDMARALSEGPGSKQAWNLKLTKNNYNISKTIARSAAANGNQNGESSVGKGFNSAETDADIKKQQSVQVTWMGRQVAADLDIALEKKVTRGHSEKVPTEDLQLKKHVIVVLLMWYSNNLKLIGNDMRDWPPPPVFHLRFSSWFFGIPIKEGQNAYHGQQFKRASDEYTTKLEREILPLFGLDNNPAYKDIFKVKMITPMSFGAETGLNPDAVTAVLVEKRQANVNAARRAVNKERRRGLAYPGPESGGFRPNPGYEPSNWLDNEEVSLRRSGNWGGWLDYILGRGWPVFKGRLESNATKPPGTATYAGFAQKLVLEKILPKLSLLSQYWGMAAPQLPGMLGLRSHGRSDPKRVMNTNANSQKFLEAFSIIAWLNKNPVVPQDAPRHSFFDLINIILRWGSNARSASRFNWTRVPARAIKTLRNQSTQDPMLAAQLQGLGLPAERGNVNYTKNLNIKLMSAAASGQNITMLLPQVYARFFVDHGIPRNNPDYVKGVKDLFKSRINVRAGPGADPQRVQVLKNLINRL